METKKTLYLIDGSAYIYRAYHAIRNLSNSAGLPTNAVFGFTRMLLKLIEEKIPEYIGIFFDSKGPTFRHEMYADYKANRPPMPDDLVVQLPYIKQVVEGMNLPIIEMPGYEADDLIGTLSRMGQEAGFSIVMVTGDKDFMQLVTEDAVIYDPMKNVVIDINYIHKTFGVSPEQVVDILGLAGDTADNVPGVPGIGQKTAMALVQTFGSVAGLYEKVDTITKKKQKENLINNKEQALLSLKLVTIDTQAPLTFDDELFAKKEPDNNALARLFIELEFRQLQQSFPLKADHSGKTYSAVFEETDLDKLIQELSESKIFAIDTETTSINPMLADLVGISVSTKPHTAVYIPFGHRYVGAPEQMSCQAVLAKLKPILEDPNIHKIGQNIKYDWMVFKRNGVDLKGVVFDTMLASYLINPSKQSHGLDSIALDFLGHKTISYEEVAGKGSQGFDTVSVDKAIPYACEDADITLLAYYYFQPLLEKAGLTKLFEDVEMPLIRVLMSMEMCGIRIDAEKLRTLSQLFAEQLGALEKQVYALAGETFNINSSQQLGHILFEKLKLPTQKKTKKKTGYSTDVAVLTTLSAKHELPAIVLQHRSLSKLKSTYTDALLDLVHPQTGRIHTSFNQTVTATGRLSSSDPNLQNIPIRTEQGREIRKAFVPNDGCCFLAADYSQIELRILAHCSDDPILIQSFKDDEDVHRRTALEVFQVLPEFVTPELRRQAKAINFGIIYGMTPFRLANELGISQKMAKNYIDGYFNRYKGVKQFIDQTIETARKTQITSTLLGRIRHIPDINRTNANQRWFAERIAVNTPIQGTAADLIKLAMIKIDAEIRKQQLTSAMLLSVHDEIVLEVPEDELSTVKKIVLQLMENVWDLQVPLKVNVGIGQNWAEAH